MNHGQFYAILFVFMRIILITGGNSSERKVSLKSAKNVKKALKENGHKVKLYDLRDGYEKLKRTALQFDILFPVLHGEEGEGGKLHKFLNKINKPIVGTRNYTGMQKAWYKIPFKTYCDTNGILTPKWKKTTNTSDIRRFGFSCVVKTSSGGSSKEVFILKSEKDLQKQKKKIFSLKNLFVEEYIEGVEITVGILNNKALSVLEIIPPKGGWFDYENKYSGKTKEILNAPSLNAKIIKEAQVISLKIHKHFNLGAYSRIDLIVRDNKIFVLELNTIPGLTENSLLPKQAGASFKEFIEALVKSAK